MVGACVILGCAKTGIGIGLAEVASKIGAERRNVQRAVNAVSKTCGVRSLRGQRHVESLVERIFDHFGINMQRSELLKMTLLVYQIAQDGWVVTGRNWAPAIAAAFTLAARSLNHAVDIKSMATFLCTSKFTIEKRINELRVLMLSIIKHLPWGDAVDFKNVHMYIQFVVDFWEELVAAMPHLRSSKLRAEGRPLAGV